MENKNIMIESKEFEKDNIFFEDINEWDNFCDELDLTNFDNMVCSKKEDQIMKWDITKWYDNASKEDKQKIAMIYLIAIQKEDQ